MMLQLVLLLMTRKTVMMPRVMLLPSLKKCIAVKSDQKIIANFDK